jgi:aspartate oxidase
MAECDFDVIVVGSGVAGLSAALRAAELNARVAVLTAGPLLAGSSPRAQGGVAAAVGADDGPALHAADTLSVGGGLNDAAVVEVLTREGSRAAHRLLAQGVGFEADLGLEAGHARRRILHAGGGATGYVLTSALADRARRDSRITLLEDTAVTELLERDGRVVGVRVARSSAAPTRSAVGQADLVDAYAAGAPPGRATWEPTRVPTPRRLNSLASAHFGPDHAAPASQDHHPAVRSQHNGLPSSDLGPDHAAPASQDHHPAVRSQHNGRASSGLDQDPPVPIQTRAPRQNNGLANVYPGSNHDAGGRPNGLHPTNGALTARAVILATGGYAALWCRTTNAPESHGSGLYLAWRAGASLADLEFVQFHPTALNLSGQSAFLLSEALRGEGGRLIDAHGDDVVDPLLPRDVVARAIHGHLNSLGPVYLSLQHLEPARVEARFGRLVETMDTFGLDLARDRLPVAPAAHYCMGGVRTDAWGRTDVGGLFAAGEVACSGAQGANRLASNSLLECLVFGARAAEAALSDSADAAATWRISDLPTRTDLGPGPGPTRPRSQSVIAVMDRGALGARLDADLGVERSAARLERLVDDLPAPDTALSVELFCAALIARAALLRGESRGAHFRADTPRIDPAWGGRIHWRRDRPPVFEEVLP